MLKSRIKNLTAVFIIIAIFKAWFTLGPVIGGDWPYYYSEHIQNLSLPGAWNSQWPYGLGGKQLPILSLKLYQQLPITLFVNYLGLPWELVQKIFWFWGFIFLAGISSYFLTRSWIGVLIYLTNSYILMVVGGGQMGIALAYAIAPLVLAFLIKRKNPVISGLILGVQVMFDLRIALVTLIALGLYLLFSLFCRRAKFLHSISYILYSGIIATLINSFWILPILASGSSGIENIKSVTASVDAVKYYSFAFFENTISLLHPNWPENIFGKVGFQKPEFLVLSILAFSSLLFIRSKIIFFAFLGLLGAFLAKGANPPFGGVYFWLFEHVPGFILFRDPTKFYLLVALSFSVLIPYVLREIPKKLKLPKGLILGAFLILWLVTIRQAVLGQLGGTFRIRQVPQEYVQLKDFIHEQDNFFRTFWIPQKQRFGFFSHNHPAIESVDLLQAQNADGVVKWLNQPSAQEQLARWGVKYVIIPYDSEEEIFLEDRQYSEDGRRKTEDGVADIEWLSRVGEFEKNVVFETRSHKDKLWIEDGRFIFSENFDKDWFVKIDGRKIYAKRTNDNLNSFLISGAKSSNIVPQYEPEKYLNYGFIVSSITLLSVLGCLLFFARR